PIVLGGTGARSPIEGDGAASVGDAVRALDLASEQGGEDVLISARVREWWAGPRWSRESSRQPDASRRSPATGTGPGSAARPSSRRRSSPATPSRSAAPA